jgi:hypothetical protein
MGLDDHCAVAIHGLHSTFIKVIPPDSVARDDLGGLVGSRDGPKHRPDAGVRRIVFAFLEGLFRQDFRTFIGEIDYTLSAV